ncbi:uncharacterized protein LOC122053702 [Zingiber officinale]|uniref:Uncharacterized protein n=1 Tax=Zingiber officinale TaxID=94328 RepID=A0A8J5HW10_ZINOF|nr:uncharacterized protein LOC122053702 [Zingiber officinale]KAG6520971.1 hypothetical protein ZIOFF_018036 [Zingiber officinale]
MALDVEDEAFFADLNKQLAMLIMDDDEEFPTQCPPLPVQEIAYMPQMIMLMPPYISEVVQRRERKGTGVFIPKSTAPRKKNKSRRPTTSSMENNNSNNNYSKRQQQKPPIYPNYNCSNSSSFL